MLSTAVSQKSSCGVRGQLNTQSTHRRTSVPLGLWTVLPGWLPPPVDGLRGALGSWFKLGSSPSESLLSSSPLWVSPPSVWQYFHLYIGTTCTEWKSPHARTVCYNHQGDFLLLHSPIFSSAQQSGTSGSTGWGAGVSGTWRNSILQNYKKIIIHFTRSKVTFTKCTFKISLLHNRIEKY